MGPSKPRSMFPRHLRLAALLSASMLAVLWLFNSGQAGPTSAAAAAAAGSMLKIGWVGHVFDQRPPSGLTFREAQVICSDNSGNLVWAYGAWHLIDHSAAELVPLQPPYTEPVKALLLPTANMLMAKQKFEAVKDYTIQVTAIAQAVEAPILLIGVGSQVRFDEAPAAGGSGSPSAATGNGSAADFSAASSISLPQQQIDFLQRVYDSRGLVVTRGQFTAAILESNGLPAPLPLGCPSLFINHNPRLGALLQQKWDAVLAKRDTNLRLAVTLPKIHKDRPYPDQLVKMLSERIFRAFPNSVVILQTLEDADTLRSMNEKHRLYLMPDQIRYYYDVQSWIDGLKACCDFVFGFRIHGTMAAVAAEVPGIVISRDYRIKELSGSMAIPTIDILQANLDPDSFDLFDFMASVPSYGKQFDARRRQVARAYVREFKRLKVPLHPGIASLAKLSDA